ncbi:MAG: histidine phosphatase family protein, partial [Clostridia bacterium]|nr:histidine phosphatase family protein [Clostridia bacterium]
KKCFAYKYPNGESMMQVAYRVYGMLDEIKQKHGDKNVLIISHGGVCRIINTYFNDMTNEEFFNYTLGNATLRSYEW